jgi:hypothetical protein
VTCGVALLAIALATGGDESLHVPLRGSARLEIPGATAAYAVDATVAEAAVAEGGVTVRGRGAGATLVAVVTAGGEVVARPIVVDPPPRRLPPTASSERAGRSRVEVQYDSASGWLANGLDVSSGSGSRVTRVELLNRTRLTTPQSADVRSTMARASLTMRTEAWEAVLLDARVEHSPLSVDGVTLRGGHLRAGGLVLHAGYTSSLWYRGFLLPSEREAAAGGSYRLSFGDRMTLAPVVYGFSSAPGQGGRSGAMTSLLYELGGPREPLRLRAEAGWGGAPGAALLLSYSDGARQLRLDARHVPAGFASLGTGRPHGTSADAQTSLSLARRVELVASGSATRQELPVLTQRREGASAEVRWHLAPRWSASGGLSVASARAAGVGVRSATLPLGLAWRGPDLGISAQYRHQRNSLLNAGGHGGRVQATGGIGRLRASAQVDAQQDDATLDLIFRQTPELARLLAELGMEVRSPEELERLLRDVPALAGAGRVAGVSLALHPWRVVSRADVSWTSRDEARQELRASILLDRARSTRRLEQSGFATLSYGRRLAGAWDVFASLAGWSRAVPPGAAQRGWSWLAGFRLTLGGSPPLPWSRSSIEGIVFRDPGGIGKLGDESTPEPGARVRLDGVREALTDARGRFVFPDASSADHRVELVLPLAAGTYFTTPSAVTVRAGEPVRFGIARTPPRLTGVLRDDTGSAVVGATVLLSGPAALAATTDSSGRFSLVGPEGEYTLAVDPGSLQPGYDLADLPSRAVRLAREVPVSEELVVRSFRSISGRVRTPNPRGTYVWLVEPHLKHAVGPDGRYVFRGLAPGRYTIAVEIGDAFERRVVDVPPGPAAIQDVDFGSAR